MDNGTAMTAHALRDRCRFSKTATAEHRAGLAVAEPVRRELPIPGGDELLDVEEFSCLAEARVVIGDWQEDYNHRRPHSSLGMRAPTERIEVHDASAVSRPRDTERLLQLSFVIVEMLRNAAAAVSASAS